MVKANNQVAFDWISQNEKKITEISDTIWRLAEVSLQEFKTSKLCADTLEKSGFTVERGIAGIPTAFVATWGEDKPVIGMLGNLDALPGLSQKALPYKEPLTEGAPGHACGHNHFTSAVMGGIATKVAMEENDISGTIKVFGCPAEEIGTGKIFILRAGCFDGLDVCFGVHSESSNGVKLYPGNAMNSVKFEFFGKASHAAASPEKGRSALDAVELMNMGINFLREHMMQEARIHYVIEDGGLRPNIVPSYARSWYYVRAPLRDQVEALYERVLKIADGADLMADTTHKTTFMTGSYQKLNNVALAKLVIKNMREIGAPTYTEEEYEFAKELGKSIPREEKMSEIQKSELPDWERLEDVDIDTNIYMWGDPKKGGAGSSDTSDIMWHIPTIQVRTAGFIVGAAGHSWQNVASMGTSIGHKSIILASKTLAATALDVLTDPDALKEIRNEFKQSTKGFTYRSPLPPDFKLNLDQRIEQLKE